MTGSSSIPSGGFVIEHEQLFLGGLLRGQGLPAVRGFLTEEHFLEEAHRLIYRAMCIAYDQSGATHLPLVARLVPGNLEAALKARANCAVYQYLGNLLAEAMFDGSDTKAVMNAARSVVEQSARIALAERMENAAIAARDPSSNVDRLLQSIGTDLETINWAVRATRFSQSRFTIGEASRRVYEMAKAAMRNGAGLTGVTWGLADIDRLTGGMQRKELILIGARPSMGKTSLMTSVALAAASAGHGIGILSMEMDAEKLTARAISDLSERRRHPIAYDDIIRGNIPDSSLDDIAEHTADLERLPIEIDEATAGTFDIRMKIETMMERFERAGWPRLDALMIDHLGFVRPGEHYRGNRNNEIGDITSSLKAFAKEYGIAVVLLSQLSRSVETRENKRPILADLRDSGNIEQDADMVAFLYRESCYLDRITENGDAELARLEKARALQNAMEFIIAKQRNGPVKTVNLWCDMAHSAVRNGERYQSYGEP